MLVMVESLVINFVVIIYSRMHYYIRVPVKILLLL